MFWECIAAILFIVFCVISARLELKLEGNEDPVYSKKYYKWYKITYAATIVSIVAMIVLISIFGI